MMDITLRSISNLRDLDSSSFLNLHLLDKALKILECLISLNATLTEKVGVKNLYLPYKVLVDGKERVYSKIKLKSLLSFSINHSI